MLFMYIPYLNKPQIPFQHPKEAMPMSATDEALKIWDALKPMVVRQIEAQTRSCVRAKKMTVTVPPSESASDVEEVINESLNESLSENNQATNPESAEESAVETETAQETSVPSKIPVGVAESYSDTFTIPAGTQFVNLEQGTPVWVYWYMNNASTMHIALNGDGTPGTGDIEALRAEISASVSAPFEYINNVVNNMASELRTEISYSDSALYSYISVSASALRTEFHDAVSDLHSSIEQTASHIRADVWAANSTMYSYIEQTASSIHSEVGNTISGLYSSIAQTASEIRADVSAANSAMYSYIQITASNIKTEIVDSMSGIYESVIEQTASYIRTEVSSSLSEIRSYTEQTRSMIVSVVGSISRIDGQLDTIEGSAIWQSENQIANLVGSLKYQDDYFPDENGNYGRYWDSTTQKWVYYEVGSSYTGDRFRMEHNLHVQEGVGMRIDKREGQESVSYGFWNQDNLTAGAIVQMINGQSSYTILADKISLQGQTWIDAVESAMAEIQTVVTGDLWANDGDFSGALDVTGYIYTAADVMIDGSSVGAAVSSFGTVTSSSGQISIPYTKVNGNTGTINFNIADTQYYQDGVSAAAYAFTVSLARVNRGYDSANNRYYTTCTATGQNSSYGVTPKTQTNTFYNDAPTISSVTAGTAVWDSSTGTYAIPLTVTLSNGYTDNQLLINFTPTEAINSVTVDLNNTSIINEYWSGHAYVIDVLIKLTNGNQTEFVDSVYP